MVIDNDDAYLAAVKTRARVDLGFRMAVGNGGTEQRARHIPHVAADCQGAAQPRDPLGHAGNAEAPAGKRRTQCCGVEAMPIVLHVEVHRVIGEL